jgi:hypothetical protein
MVIFALEILFFFSLFCFFLLITRSPLFRVELYLVNLRPGNHSAFEFFKKKYTANKTNSSKRKINEINIHFVELDIPDQPTDKKGNIPKLSSVKYNRILTNNIKQTN